MKRITTLTGKNIPRLSVARGGWPTLDHLLEGVTPDNLHGEIDAGEPVGNEFGSKARVCDDMGLKLRDEK